MSKTTHAAITVAAALAAGLLLTAGTGCAHHHSGHGTQGWEANPPVWAPAQGARHTRRDGVVLVFVKEIDAYRVKGHPSHYYHRDRYYRQHGVRWERARHIKGPWVAVDLHTLPPGLKKHHHRHLRDPQRAVERRRGERERAKPRRIASKQRGSRERFEPSDANGRDDRRDEDAF